MPTLSLFRHAKSSWSDPSLGDFNRPLAPRGLRDAPRMGKYQASNDLIPDLVYCSTAVRAQETLSLAMQEWDRQPDVQLIEALYHASTETLLDVVMRTRNEIGHVMLVGHNPGMHSFSHMMVGSGSREALNLLSIKFPTAALAVLTMPGGWENCGFGLAELHTFVSPKLLPE